MKKTLNELRDERVKLTELIKDIDVEINNLINEEIKLLIDFNNWIDDNKNNDDDVKLMDRAINFNNWKRDKKLKDLLNNLKEDSKNKLNIK